MIVELGESRPCTPTLLNSIKLSDKTFFNMVVSDGLYTLFTTKTYQMCMNIIAFPNCVNDQNIISINV